jgi:hypothetical protein
MESLVNPSDRKLYKWTADVLRDFPDYPPTTVQIAKSPYYMFRCCDYVRSLSND